MPTNQIINDVEPRTQFIATSSQTVFNVSWTADAAASVLVYARADGVAADDATQLVSSSDYAVTFIGTTATVRVTFSSGRTLDDIITIVRSTDSERTNLYINTNFTPSMLNQDFGIETMVQQQNDMYARKFAPHYNFSCTYTDNTDTDIDLILPVLGASQSWAMNATSTAIEAYDLSETGGLVNAITGTANEIDVDSTDPTTPILSLPANIKIDGILDSNAASQLLFSTTASAVNYTQITNAATGSGPTIAAVGTDANIDLNINAKGTGDILFDGSDVICGDPGSEASGINIGGVTYNSILKVSNITSTNSAQFIMHRHSTTLHSILIGARSNSDTSSHAAVTAGQSCLTTYGAGWTGTEYNLFGSIDIGVDATGTISDTSSPGRIRLQVTLDGATVPTTALTISNDKTATFAGAVEVPSIDVGSSTVIDGFIDDDTFATASATTGATSESIKTYVDSMAGSGGNVPVGTIFSFGGTSAPAGSLECDGSAVSRTTYSELFTAVSTTWGVGDGSTTFNLPNFQRSVAVGSGGTGTGELGNSVGDTGGAETSTLIGDNMPANVGRTSGLVVNSSLASGATTFVAGTGGTWKGGLDTPVDIIQPSNVVLMCIAYQPNAVTAAAAASQSEMEAGTDNAVFSTPGRQNLHPGHPKGWLYYNQVGTPAILASYNVTSVADDGAGIYTITWDVDFSTADYSVVVSAGSAGGGSNLISAGVNLNAGSPVIAAGTVQCVCVQGTAETDVEVNTVAAFGDQ